MKSWLLRHKAFLLIPVFMLLAAVFIVTAPIAKSDSYFSGSGTQADPYQITNAADLAQLAVLVNAQNVTYYQQYYIQTQDIDLSGYDWTPIGTKMSKCFTGVFDGCHRNITGLRINTATPCIGLFGYSTGTLKNIHIIDGSINVNSTLGICIYAGGITGVNDGPVENCSFSGTINITADCAADTGGIVGYASGSVRKCFNSGNITGKYVGGITGSLLNADLSDCYNTGSVTGISVVSTAGSAGGIAGSIQYGGVIRTSYNIGSVSGQQAGGITGGINHGNSDSIQYCYYLDNIDKGVWSGGETGTNKKTDAELKLQSTYSGFDFTDTWEIGNHPDYAYPELIEPEPQTVYSVMFDLQGANGTLTGSGTYTVGDTVTITVAPDNGYVFKNWIVKSGGAALADASSPTTTFAMPAWNVSITAVFEKIKYTVTIENSGRGTVTGAGAYAWGGTVPITAAETSGNVFMRWEDISGDISISNVMNPSASFTMPQSNVIIKARFTANVNITGNGTYDIGSYGNDSNITIAPGLTVKLTDTGAATYNDMRVVCGAGTALTISGVEIDNSGEGSCPICFTGINNKLILEGNSSVQGGSQSPGVKAAGSASLEISGAGSLVAAGGANAAGIGGNYQTDGGTINMTGGTINATGGTGAAGIGGGAEGDGGAVNITGAVVTAQGSGGGYDIGSGNGSGSGGTLNLDGCAALTLSSNGTNAGVTKGDFYITDKSTASPIESGYYVNGSKFTGTIIDLGAGTITGSGASFYYTYTVSLNSPDYDYLITGSTTRYNVFIHSGTDAPTDIILFDASIVCNTTSPNGLAMGVLTDPSPKASNAVIELCGNNTLTGYHYAGLSCPGGSTLTIKGNGSLTATSSENGSPGIGGDVGGCGDINVLSGTINAVGGANAAGIGGGNCTGCGNITISGGTVTATGGANGAGIGCGSHANTSYGEASIVITGSANVTATGGIEGAGIGGGYNDINSYTVEISGGRVTATGGSDAPGIGDGAYCNISNSSKNYGIKISGGWVSAHGTGWDGAGIGGGDYTHINGRKIVFTGGTVYAISDKSYGIGRGYDPYVIDISGGTVYTEGQASQYEYDIDAFSISGSAALFLKNDRCRSATTSTHVHYAITGANGGSIYGIPCDFWTGSFGSYLRLYTLSYDGTHNTGSTPGSVTQQAGTVLVVSDGHTMSRMGYTFSEWNTAADGSGTAYDHGDTNDTFTFNANTTLYPQWTPIGYSITYELSGGTASAPNPDKYTTDSPDITLNNPLKQGYDFAGWSGTGIGGTSSDVIIYSGSSGERSYTANWTPHVYTITYDLGGGSVDGTNPDTYTIKSLGITLNNPGKQGYDFAGWSGTDISEASSCVVIPAGSKGDRSYTANWTTREYTITYDLAGGSLETPNRTSYTIETPGFTLGNPTKTGYVFTGWTTADNPAPNTLEIINGYIRQPVVYR